jgi:ribosomal protein L37AE/L43A
MEIKVKRKFKALKPKLKPKELAILEQDILEHGIKEPLIVWDKLVEVHEKRGNYKCYSDSIKNSHCDIRMGLGVWHCEYCGHGVAPIEYEYLLLDGHKRYEIALKHNLNFEVVLLEDEALLWDNDNDAIDYIKSNL